MSPTQWWTQATTIAAQGAAAYVAVTHGVDVPAEYKAGILAAIAAAPAGLVHIVQHSRIAGAFAAWSLARRRREAALVAAYVQAALENAQRRKDAANTEVVPHEEDPVPVGVSDRS